MVDADLTKLVPGTLVQAKPMKAAEYRVVQDDGYLWIVLEANHSGATCKSVATGMRYHWFPSELNVMEVDDA